MISKFSNNGENHHNHHTIWVKIYFEMEFFKLPHCCSRKIWYYNRNITWRLNDNTTLYDNFIRSNHFRQLELQGTIFANLLQRSKKSDPELRVLELFKTSTYNIQPKEGNFEGKQVILYFNFYRRSIIEKKKWRKKKQ